MTLEPTSLVMLPQLAQEREEVAREVRPLHRRANASSRALPGTEHRCKGSCTEDHADRSNLVTAHLHPLANE